ncbi:MAG TPA: alpha/beta fold hydrolase [Gemmatimonadales bacterium]|nr:alpha/beta fold hydrolase [Gemmatimonadales bacterium]
MRQLAVALIVFILAVWIGAVAVLKAGERSLVYFPGDRAVPEPHPSFALRHMAVEFPASDGVRLHAWIVPAAAADSSGFWLLIAHGNYGSIGFGDRPAFYAAARDIGLNLLAFDYRGFGRSGGRADEEGLYRDAEAAYRYLTDSLQVPPDRIVLFGHSLGTGVATELATRVPSAALVLEAAYTSLPDIGQAAYPWVPVGLLAGERFETIDRIGKVTVPKLLLHSPEDDIVPYAHGRRVYEAANGSKRFVTVRGGHAGAFSEDRETYFGAIRELVESLP